MFNYLSATQSRQVFLSGGEESTWVEFPGVNAGTKAFSYDANGNLVSDARKGLALSWNILNFVSRAEMYDGSLTYCWLSDGTKVSVRAEQDGHGGDTEIGVAKRYFGSFMFSSDVDPSECNVPESVGWYVAQLKEQRLLVQPPLQLVLVQQLQQALRQVL